MNVDPASDDFDAEAQRTNIPDSQQNDDIKWFPGAKPASIAMM
jgi:hypothetical protein